MTEPLLFRTHRNGATGRFHPFVYRPSPLPSDDHTPGATMRYRSSMHHTEGFPTLEAAQQEQQRLLPALQRQGEVVVLDDVQEDFWNDGDIPTATLHRARSAPHDA